MPVRTVEFLLTGGIDTYTVIHKGPGPEIPKYFILSLYSATGPSEGGCCVLLSLSKGKELKWRGLST